MPFSSNNMRISGGLDERENQCGGRKQESEREGRGRVCVTQSKR